MPLVRRRSDGYLRRRRNLCNTSQTIANNLDLRIELRFISQLLKIAAATRAKIRTRRLDANSRRLDDLRDRGKGHLAAHPINSHTQYVAGSGQGDEQRSPFGMRQTDTTGQNTFDCHLNGRRRFPAGR